MENLMLLLAGTIAQSFSFKTKKRKRQTIGNTGCYVPLFHHHPVIQHWQNKEGEEVYFGEVNNNDIAYGLVVVPLKKHCLVEPGIAISDLFHKLFCNMNMRYRTGIISEISYGKGIQAISEYWQNSKGMDCKVKGFTDGKIMALLYVNNISALSAVQMEAYLNSFCFSQ